MQSEPKNNANAPQRKPTGGPAVAPVAQPSSVPEPALADHGKAPALPREIGGPPGPEPTRYGDWQYNGRGTDF